MNLASFYLPRILIPLFLFAVFAPWSARIDLMISNYFFVDGHFSTTPFVLFMYQYGIFPTWVVIGLADIAFIVSFFKARWKKWRVPALYLILVLGVGSGVLIHFALKDHWGRPRPRQVIEYGGNQTFKPFYEPHWDNKEPSKSFACGHCSMGFFFFAVMLLGKAYQNRYIYYGGMATAWILGGALSYARIAQGGHFFSDVVASALIMWITVVIFFPLIGNVYERRHT